MCTLLALLHPNPHYRLLFLENRDRPVEGYQGGDFRILEPNHVAVVYDFRSQGIVCGYAAATGVYGGLTNVLGYVGRQSRGVLLKDVLTQSANLLAAIRHLASEAATGRYSPANYVLGDDHELYRIENYARDIHISRSRVRQVATNHFRYLPRGKRLVSSVERERFVTEFVVDQPNPSVTDLRRLAARHGDGGAICRHGHTLASAMFAVATGKQRVVVRYKIGHPCKGYRRVRLA